LSDHPGVARLTLGTSAKQFKDNPSSILVADVKTSWLFPAIHLQAFVTNECSVCRLHNIFVVRVGELAFRVTK
jgi:hypothetical protein